MVMWCAPIPSMFSFYWGWWFAAETRLPSTEYRCKNDSDDWKRCPLWTSVSRRGTNLWHNLRNLRCSWTMENTLTCEIFSMLAISCSVMGRFSLMISSTRSTFATVLDAADLPARYSSVGSVRPASNCLHHFTIPGREIARSPYSVVISRWTPVQLSRLAHRNMIVTSTSNLEWISSWRAIEPSPLCTYRTTVYHNNLPIGRVSSYYIVRFTVWS